MGSTIRGRMRRSDLPAHAGLGRSCLPAIEMLSSPASVGKYGMGVGKKELNKAKPEGRKLGLMENDNHVGITPYIPPWQLSQAGLRSATQWSL